MNQIVPLYDEDRSYIGVVSVKGAVLAKMGEAYSTRIVAEYDDHEGLVTGLFLMPKTEEPTKG